MEADMKWNWSQFRRGNILVERGMILVFVVFSAYLFSNCGTVIERGRRTSCNSNLKQMGLAFHLYASEHGERYPTNVTELSKYVGGDTNENAH
jgi:hypothetical protein